jgi:hypothetical protein
MWAIFVLLDPDPADKRQCGSGFGSTAMLSGLELEPFCWDSNPRVSLSLKLNFSYVFIREKLSELSKLLEWPPSFTHTFDCFFVSERSCLSCSSGRAPPPRSFDFFLVSERSCLSCLSCWSGRPTPPRPLIFSLFQREAV